MKSFPTLVTVLNDFFSTQLAGPFLAYARILLRLPGIPNVGNNGLIAFMCSGWFRNVDAFKLHFQERIDVVKCGGLYDDTE